MIFAADSAPATVPKATHNPNAGDSLNHTRAEMHNNRTDSILNEIAIINHQPLAALQFLQRVGVALGLSHTSHVTIVLSPHHLHPANYKRRRIIQGVFCAQLMIIQS